MTTATSCRRFGNLPPNITPLYQLPGLLLPTMRLTVTLAGFRSPNAHSTGEVRPPFAVIANRLLP